MRSWYHTIDLPDGTSTPGFYDTRGAPPHVPWPHELSGGRCLDVGTFDGFWAFEMERRGAGEVVAIDVDDPEQIDWPYDNRRRGPSEVRSWGAERGPGFVEASERLGSSVVRVTRSVYDLDPEVDGAFDVVFCGALLLHLRDPIRALERMREVCRRSLVLVEEIDAPLDLRVRRTAAARLSREIDQWWRVNSAGLAGMTRKAGFRVVASSPRFVVPFGDGAVNRRGRVLSSLLARTRTRGVLYRALRATPRPPADAEG